MPRPFSDTTQMNLRVPKGWHQDFEALAEKMSASRRVPVSKAQAIREAMMVGLMKLLETP